MNFTPYQIFVPLLSFMLIAYVWRLVYHQKKTIWEAAMWTIFWGVIAYMSLFPNQLLFLRRVTGIQRYENAILVTAVGMLFLIIFYLVIRLENLEQRVTKLVRSQAVKDMDEKGKDA